MFPNKIHSGVEFLLLPKERALIKFVRSPISAARRTAGCICTFAADCKSGWTKDPICNADPILQHGAFHFWQPAVLPTSAAQVAVQLAVPGLYDTNFQKYHIVYTAFY